MTKTMTPLAQWAVKNYTPEVRNVGLRLGLRLRGVWALLGQFGMLQMKSGRVLVGLGHGQQAGLAK